MRLKKLLVAGMTVPVLVLAACSSDDGGDSEATSDESSASEETDGADASSGPQPDLEGIPDVVAEVNGEEISKDDFVPAFEQQFQQMAAQSQMTGQQPDQDALKQQVVETLVNTELLDQTADDRGFEASDEEVDATLTELAKSNQMPSAKEFLAALEEQGMSADEVKSQVATQVKVEQLLADEAGDLGASQAELRKAYDEYTAQQKQAGQKAPSFKELRPQLKEQVEGQKLNTTAQALLKDVREDADITIHV